MAKFYIDTANLDEIKGALSRGFQGVTTNPSLLAKEPKGNYMAHLGKVADLCRAYPLADGSLPSLSVEGVSSAKKKKGTHARGFIKAT